MTNETKYCILTAYHKKDILLKSDIITPIHVGKDILSKKNDENSKNNYKWLKKNMIGDNDGINISSKNSYYNEMTAIYYAWKNYNKIGNPQYIGLMHYRRHFYINKLNDNMAYFECESPKDIDNYINNKLGLTNKNLDDIFSRYDFLVSTPYYKESVYKHFKDSHKIEELDEVEKIIKQDYRKYYKSCKKYLNGHDTYFCNMFIFPKKIFFEYCEFIFGVLEKFEKSPKYTSGRFFVSERITGTFIQYLIDSGKKYATAPTMFMEDSLTIPVAFATDLNYLNPTLVAISSMLKNAKQSTIYDIYLMCPHNATMQIKKDCEFLNDLYSNFKLNILDMENSFTDTKMTIEHITSQTYYRLKLPKLLSNYDKCLYLDGDIVINNDLSELYRNNIAEHYVAGVRAPGYYYPETWVEKHKKELGIKDFKNYINAGVLLLNLKKLRDEKIDEKMLSLVNKNFSSQDQDIINLVCYDKIKILPAKYNLMTKYLSFNEGKVTINKQDQEILGETECKIAMENPTIIHYADKIKPWQNSSVIYFDNWQSYAKDVPAYKERKKSKVSVIIPVYNMEEYLGECLDSVFSQNLDDFDVICINDGSKDNSLTILNNYKEQHQNLYVINQNNHGVAYTRNVGIDFANSEFVIFMDPDDKYPTNDILKTLYDTAKKQKVSVCGGSWSEMIQTADNKIIYKDKFVGMNDKYTFEKDGLIKYSDYQFDFGYQRFLISLDLLKKHNIKFPLYSRFQDPPFFCKTMIAANEFYAIKKITYLYRIGYQGSTIFKGKKIIDLMLGLIDDLRISSRNGLAHLHKLTLDRLNGTYGNVVYDRILIGDEPYLFELLVRANTAVDRNLLKKEIPSINENYVIAPLKKLMTHLSNCISSKNFKNVKKDKLHDFNFKHIKEYLKNYGLKAMIIRLFKGKAKATEYLDKKLKKNRGKK